MRGPAGALAATLHRLGWQLVSACVLRDDLGAEWDMRVTCPRTLCQLLTLATDRWIWSRAAVRVPEFAQFGREGPFLQPIASLLRQKQREAWTPSHVAALRSCVVGGEWT